MIRYNITIDFYKTNIDDNSDEKNILSHFYYFFKTDSSDIDNCYVITKFPYEQNRLSVFQIYLDYIWQLFLQIVSKTYCEIERSFSKLAMITSRLRSTHIEERLYALMSYKKIR